MDCTCFQDCADGSYRAANGKCEKVRGQCPDGMIINQFGLCDKPENMRDPFDCAPFYGKSPRGTFFMGYKKGTAFFGNEEDASQFISDTMHARLDAADAADGYDSFAFHRTASLMEEKNAYQRMNCGGINAMKLILGAGKDLQARHQDERKSVLRPR